VMNNSMENGEKFSKLPNEVFNRALDEIIEENLHKSPESFNIECSAGSSKGDNYMGIIYKIVVKSKEDDAEKLNVILKVAPENEARREMCNANMVFNREIDFYFSLNEIYKTFQASKGVNVESDGFRHVCKCYKSIKDPPHEALFLENLKAKGYDMNDRFKDLTREHVLLIMKALGKFHATGFAIKDQNPKLIENWFDLKDVFLVNEGVKSFSDWYENCKQQCRNAVKDSITEEQLSKLDAFFQLDMFEIFPFLCLSKHAEPYAVINHGDVS
jgi:Ecdysteroid kinase-like family